MMRRALAADVPAIAVVEAECFGAGAWSEELVREHLTGDHRVAFVDADLTAYGAISLLGDTADLDRIAVVPSARRRGVARELLGGLIEHAGGHSIVRMLLEVAADNDAAIGLYESYGFTTISTRKSYYSDGIDALIMQRAIQDTI